MPGVKKDPSREYSPNWGGKRDNLAGRVGRKPTGRQKIYRTLSIAGTDEEVSRIRELAEESGKSVSRYVIDTLLGI